MHDEQSGAHTSGCGHERVGRLKRDELPPERVVVGAEIALAIVHVRSGCRSDLPSRVGYRLARLVGAPSFTESRRTPSLMADLP